MLNKKKKKQVKSFLQRKESTSEKEMFTLLYLHRLVNAWETNKTMNENLSLYKTESAMKINIIWGIG